jgi:hypothetical protein
MATEAFCILNILRKVRTYERNYDATNHHLFSPAEVVGPGSAVAVCLIIVVLSFALHLTAADLQW